MLSTSTCRVKMRYFSHWPGKIIDPAPSFIKKKQNGLLIISVFISLERKTSEWNITLRTSILLIKMKFTFIFFSVSSLVWRMLSVMFNTVNYFPINVVKHLISKMLSSNVKNTVFQNNSEYITNPNVSAGANFNNRFKV